MIDIKSESENEVETDFEVSRTIQHATTTAIAPKPHQCLKVTINSAEVVNCGNKYTNEVFYDDKVIHDIPLPKYFFKSVKKSTKVERVSCGVVTLSVLFSVTVMVYYFLVVVKITTEPTDTYENEWYIRKDLWMSSVFEKPTPLAFEPVKMIVIQHTVSPKCTDFRQCGVAMNMIQKNYIQTHHTDIPYNFVIGNDGRVYEGRGWAVEGGNSRRFNPCSISIAYVGNYNHISVADIQLNRTKMLLDEGVRLGQLHPNYTLVGARDIQGTESPGNALYEAIQKFEHYDTRYRDKICEQIHAQDDDESTDEGDWFISRKKWGGQPYYNDKNATTKYAPLKLVIINNSVTTACYSFAVCAIKMKRLQDINFLQDRDIPYNFAIGNDGRVYEGRGWGIDGSNRVRQFQACALNIGFIGHYAAEAAVPTRVSPIQVRRAQALLEEGLKLNHIHKDYLLVAAKDVLHSLSPGEFLYEEIRTWEHYDHKLRNKTMTCDDIQALD